jgi:hypothetical protein
MLGMSKKKSGQKVKPVDDVRICANIRSRKHPDVRCPCIATQGDFCARHSKNPTRFQEKLSISESNLYIKVKACEKIKRWWVSRRGFLRFLRQGPATSIPAEAENQTDIYTLDPTSSIPMLYRWSYTDSKRHIWLFDIRSLSMTRAQDTQESLLNPYTREEIEERWLKHFQERCAWLRKRKYCLVHTFETEMTPEQLWHQKILDVTMKYDVLGYHTSLNWFEELNITKLSLFYQELWELWYYRLQLGAQVKELVVPNWNKAETLLFKWTPSEVRFRTERKWWQKTIIELLDRFVSSAQLKEHKILGALYGMTAFAIVSPRVRQHYPWLVEMEDE